MKSSDNWFKTLLSYAKGSGTKLAISVILSVISLVSGIVPYFCVYKMLDAYMTSGLDKETVLFWGLVALGMYFVKDLNRKRGDLFIYLDPPYVEKGHYLYMNYFQKEDHVQLSKFIYKIKKKWMISYDKNDLILESYSRWNMIQYQLMQCTSNRKKYEILAFSDDILFEKSIQKLSNADLLINNHRYVI